MRPRARRPVAILVAAILVTATPLTAVAKGKPAPPGPTSIAFSEYSWTVKDHNRKIGPGPNFFSAANVSVDTLGRLHLQIRKSGNRWTVAEVIANASLGYGTYTWTIASPPSFDPNVVLGLFTWNDAPDFNHREIDIEYAKWGNASDQNNAQYVVQPYSTAGNEHRFRDPYLAAGVTHSFTWRPDRVDFLTRYPNGTTYAWSYTGRDVPVPGGENARINFWLFRGSAPVNGQNAEVIIESFAHTPLGGS